MENRSPLKAVSAAGDLEDFKTLTSTKQNVELFKILSAIAVEIENLRVSTERRFSVLEAVVQRSVTANAHANNEGRLSRNSSNNGSTAGPQWEAVKANRAYNHYKNMAG